MVECGICLEEYEEGDLELHRQICEVRLMFRCSLCDGNYVNKEGLWNHLDLHEIADESKELHYQEIKAKHKLHQCVLCNDQRAYSEISYWKHVHDVHDGFFLRCSDCGENFRSEKLKNDHDSSRCKARHPMNEDQVPVEVGNMTADAERLKLSWGDQSSNTNEGPDNRLSIDYADENIIDKESELPTINLRSQFPCDICGKSFSSKQSRFRHKAAKYTCSSSSTKCFHCNKECISARSLRKHISNLHQPTKCGICGITFEGYSQARYHKATKHKEGRHQCPHCSRKFYVIKILEGHVSCCASLKHSCELCGQRFKLQRRVDEHKKRFHHGSRPFRDANIEGAECTEEKKQDSVEKIDAAEEISCIVCKISFASTDELMKHKLNCPKHSKDHDDSQFSTENISLLHGVSEAQADSTIVPLGDNIEIKLEIEVEETMLQEQEFQVPNETLEKSSATTLTGAEVIGPANLIELGYVPVKSCSLEDAKLFVKNFEFGFGLRCENISKKGSMRYYRCLRFKQSARPQCERKLLIFTPNINQNSTVCVKGDHSCMNAPPRKLTSHVKIDFAPVKMCSIEDAKSFVKNFEFGFSYDREKGNMLYYRCSRIKSRARPQCERKVLICTPNINEKSTVCAKGEHSCINAPTKNLTRHIKIVSSYAPVKTCSFEDAKVFVKKFEFGFSFMVENDRDKGIRRYYRCSRIKALARPQCERKVMICTPNKNEESTVYARGEHSCMNTPPRTLKRAQIGFGYAPVKTCSFEDAKSFVKDFEFGFAFRMEDCRVKGNVRQYRCSRIKSNARPQCKRKVMIYTPDKNEESIVCTKGEHSCINAPPENLICVKRDVKAKPSVEQADITIKSGVPKKEVRNHVMLLRTSVSKNRLHT